MYISKGMSTTGVSKSYYIVKKDLFLNIFVLFSNIFKSGFTLINFEKQNDKESIEINNCHWGRKNNLVFMS